VRGPRLNEILILILKKIRKTEYTIYKYSADFPVATRKQMMKLQKTPFVEFLHLL